MLIRISAAFAVVILSSCGPAFAPGATPEDPQWRARDGHLSARAPVRLERHAVSGDVLADGVATGATVSTVKTISVVGEGLVVLDFANGTFAPGTAAGPGIQIELTSGSHVRVVAPVLASSSVSYSGVDAALIGFGDFPDISVSPGVTHAILLGSRDDFIDASGFGGRLEIDCGGGRDSVRPGPDTTSVDCEDEG